MRKFIKKLLQNLKRPFRWFLRLRRRNKIGVILILVVVAFFVIGRFSGGNGDDEYNTTTVRRGDITQVVSETGTLNSGGSVPVYSPTNGVITDIYVKNGQSVGVGDRLYSVESSATKEEQAAAYASYLQAKTAVDASNASMYSLQAQMFTAWDKFKEMADSDEFDSADERDEAEYIVAEKSWLAAEANYKNQKAVVSQAEASLNSASLAYQATQNATVFASVNGKVANLSVAKGGVVAAFSQTSAVPPTLILSQDGNTEVVVRIGENDIALIEEGQEAKIDIEALGDGEYKGVVSRVDRIGSDAEGVVRYSVYVAVLNPDERFRSGMTADVEIVTDRLEDVLLVPNSSVKPYQGGRAVRIKSEDGEVEYIPVQVGVRGRKNTQILKGIEAGDEVITSLSNNQLERPGIF